MAKAQGVWGIDIGQCGLKALRCLPHEKSDRITAEAFDYIEYPKILSQPEADADELVSDALEQFLSRNEVKGDRVAISVAGQNGLARFIKLPPVESRKIPDIVKYEARQQIPFDLNDVIWDYQQMAGGMEEEGYVLETEVGLFAMKREQVIKAMFPFNEAKVEVDIIQLAPLALYNMVTFDQMQELDDDFYDADDPPESVLLISMGTDTTDLVITNGFRVWQRSIPLGGSHFTKALSKELKQTFAKAEHIKRNATKAENPKMLFQAMRPVFTDLVTEVQRSISFFSNIDRKAKISRIVPLGNAVKLPGLVRYLSQNLELPVEKPSAFRGLKGSGVVDAPAFKENLLSFGICYGLCLQGLADTKIYTNLIPPEIVKDRLIRSKKPWAVAAAATLMLGLSVSYGGYWQAWNTSRPSDEFVAAESESQQLISQVGGWRGDFQKEVGTYQNIDAIGQQLLLSDRDRWLNLLQALNAALPRDPAGQVPEVMKEQNRLYITGIKTQRRNLGLWFNEVLSGGQKDNQNDDPAMIDDNQENQPQGLAVQSDVKPPSGMGWVITMMGYHYHNDRAKVMELGANYVNRTLVENLRKDSITIESSDGGSARLVPVKKLGLDHVFTPNPGSVDWDHKITNPEFDPKNPADVPPKIDAPVYNFEIQFCWYDELPEGQSKESPGGPHVAGQPDGGIN